MFQVTGSFRRARRFAVCSTIAALLAIGCPSSGRSQQATPAAVSPEPPHASIKSSSDIQEGIRDGRLFYASAPRLETALRQVDGTPAGYSFTVPITVDRVHNRIFVRAVLDGRQARLIMDTGGGHTVSLNEATAYGIELAGKVPLQRRGMQGTEQVTLGVAKSLTLGPLTLQQIATTVSRNSTFNDCTLGMGIFEHYRVTLDFAASTMTLTRGNTPMPSPGGAALSTPFVDVGGYIFLPVSVLGQSGWAFLDSGSDVTMLSFEVVTAAAARLTPADTKTMAFNQKIGFGDTARKFKIVGSRYPIPISMNAGHGDADFNSTSWVGTSNINEAFDSHHIHLAAQLGFPFFLQFQRVIIDYPSHTLILQYPAHNAFVKVMLSPTDHDKSWPGYKWLQKGYAWIEVPDGKSAPGSPSHPAGPQLAITPTIVSTTENGTTTITRTTEAGTTISRVLNASHAAVARGVAVTVSSSTDDGNITVAVNGVKTLYPPGSTITVEDDGSVNALPLDNPTE